MNHFRNLCFQCLIFITKFGVLENFDVIFVVQVLTFLFIEKCLVMLNSSLSYRTQLFLFGSEHPWSLYFYAEF